MVVVVIALAETDEGDQPTVSAAVLCPVRLSADHMTERIDGEGRIEDHEHPEQATHEEPADAPEKRAVPPESDTERNDKAGGDNGPVVLVLPENYRIAAESDFIFPKTMRRLIEEPAAVAMPKTSGCIVGVFVGVRTGVVANVVCAPDQRRVLQRPSAGDQRQALDPIGTVKTLMRDQPVIADRDPHSRHDIHDKKVHPVKQRIADIVSVERNAHDRGDDDGTEEKTRYIGKSGWQGLGNTIRLGHVSSS